MTTAGTLEPVLGKDIRLGYKIIGTRYRFVVARPQGDPGLWSEYLAGAYRAYAKYGCESALESVWDGKNTAVFLAAVDVEGTVVGGVRAQGPYVDAGQAHALEEWAGRPGERELRAMITDRLPFGVIEAKTAWTSSDIPDGRLIAQAIGRAVFSMASLLGAQFGLATASDHVIKRWESTGARIATSIPAVPYPTPDLPTKVIWWDRRTTLNLAKPEFVPAMLREVAELRAGMHALSRESRLKLVGPEGAMAVGM